MSSLQQFSWELKRGTLLAWIYRAPETLGWTHGAQYRSKSDSKGTQEFFPKSQRQQEGAKAGTTHAFSSLLVTFLFQANVLCSLLGLSTVELRFMFQVGKWKESDNIQVNFFIFLMLHIIQHLAMAYQSTNLHIIYKEKGRETGEERKSQMPLSFLASKTYRKGIYPQKWDHEIPLSLFQLQRRGRTSRRGKGTEKAFCFWGDLSQVWVLLLCALIIFTVWKLSVFMSKAKTCM